MKKKSIKNITRYTYKHHSFEGYRVAVSHRRMGFYLYFSDRRYGGERAALDAALACKVEVRAAIAMHGDSPEELEAAFDGIRKKFSTRKEKGVSPA